ncbi:LysR family transcriptional regulator [Novosphingobium sp. Leaf2]|uniref:LysR family transcriptional regulator n=1 Tax=Novosphingobium sp. Leaf2 TaxID=1735670 RepID=UPI0006FF277D|nr:LysR family transcriptional regulator [Novosphingobium sp. Leaf2]KQM21540.1 LysR family transcriptional regulator [Novosphingobium sp. Leaf2]
MDPLTLNTRHLRAMVEIVGSRRISSAARAVNLTQPAVTQGIAKLEAQIGLPLFDRRPDGMLPTEAARVLAPRVQAALRLIGNRRATGAQMRAYLALAETGSYAAAAAMTGLSQASLHRAVSDLSTTVGQKLVERRGRGIVLTARGAALARNFRLARSEMRSAIAELSSLQGRETGRIVVGAMPLSRARLLPKVISLFHARHPEVDLSIVEGSYGELIGPLRDGEIDLLVGALRPHQPEGIAQQALFEDHPIIIGRAGHPLAKPWAANPADLVRFPWIVPAPGTPLRTQWHVMFESAGVEPPRVPIECGSVIMVRQILVDSDFLTLLSADQVRVELDAGWLVAIGNALGDVSRTIGISTREDWRPTALQSLFTKALAEQATLMNRPIS